MARTTIERYVYCEICAAKRKRKLNTTCVKPCILSALEQILLCGRITYYHWPRPLPKVSAPPPQLNIWYASDGPEITLSKTCRQLRRPILKGNIHASRGLMTSCRSMQGEKASNITWNLQTSFMHWRKHTNHPVQCTDQLWKNSVCNFHRSKNIIAHP